MNYIFNEQPEFNLFFITKSHDLDKLQDKINWNIYAMSVLNTLS